MRSILRLLLLFFFVLPLPFLLFSQQNDNDPERESPDIAQKRAEWFAHQRGVEPGQLPSLRRLQAFRHLEQMRTDEMQRATALATGSVSPEVVAAVNPLSSTPWKAIGPAPLSAGTPVSGRVAALAVDPRNALVVYAGAADGGVWKTTDGGQSWTPLTDNQPSLSTGSIALDPSNPDTIYVGTGEYNGGDGYPGVGILKSTDGGSTWTHIQGPFIPRNVGFRIPAIAVSPANSQIVLAAAGNSGVNEGTAGVFRSTDGGNTWTNVLPSAWAASSVAFDPNAGNVAYAGLVIPASGGGFTLRIMKSTDSGATWSQTGFADAAGFRIIISIAPSDSSVYVAYTPMAANSAVLSRSQDGGETFTALNSSSLCSAQCAYNLAMGVNPANSKELFFGGITVVHSLDGGASWASAGSGHADQHVFVFSASGDRIYVGNDGGVWVSTSHASDPVSVNSLNSNLATLQFYPGISIAPGNPSFGLGGTQDNGSDRYSGSLQWQEVFGGDGFSTAIDPNTPSTFYLSTQVGNIFKTTDNGGTFSEGSGLTGTSSFNTVFTLDRLNPSRLYTTRNLTVLQTTDGASTWHPISPQINTLNANDIEVAPSDSNTVWIAVCCGQVFVSRNASSGAGATWTQFNSPTKRPVTAVKVSPTDPSTAYAVVSGFAADFVGVDQVPGHVFKVTNGGATWTDMTGNLPDVPMSDIAIDPAIPDTFYVATDIGVFTTSNGGSSWDTVVTNLPRSVIVSLALDPQSRILRAATHGRSMFDLQLPAAPPPPSCTPSSTAATPSVTICSPTNGSNVSSPVHVTAATKSATTVIAMKVYDNGTQVFSTSSSSVDTNLTMTPGTHTITVNAWNSGGQVFKSAVTVTVGGTGGGACTPSSTAATPSVTICSPTDGSTVSSPVHVTAATKSATTVVAMKVYDNGTQVFSTSASSVDTNLPMTAGTHKITVNAWNSGGQVFVSAVTVTVGGGGGGACTPSSTAPTPSVTICSPANGASVTSPVNVTAATKSATQVTAMKVYDNGVQVFATSSSSVNTNLTMTAGSHTITVNAWNTGGQVFKSAVNITVH